MTLIFIFFSIIYQSDLLKIVRHLLYPRFIQLALFDLALVTIPLLVQAFYLFSVSNNKQLGHQSVNA